MICRYREHKMEYAFVGRGSGGVGYCDVGVLYARDTIISLVRVIWMRNIIQSCDK